MAAFFLRANDWEQPNFVPEADGHDRKTLKTPGHSVAELPGLYLQSRENQKNVTTRPHR